MAIYVSWFIRGTNCHHYQKINFSQPRCSSMLQCYFSPLPERIKDRTSHLRWDVKLCKSVCELKVLEE
jgi:hypothetical protein